jgi:LuxR family maltose regulon positive regulatory protein
LAHILRSEGDAVGANKRVEQAVDLAAAYLATINDGKYVASEQAHLWLRQGNLEAARRWASGLDHGKFAGAQELDTGGSLGARIIVLYELIVFARLLIADEDQVRALSVLRLILPSLEDLGYASKLIEVHVLMALGFSGCGDEDQALSSVGKAIQLAKPEGYRRIFLEEGHELAALLEKIGEGEEPSQFAGSLLEAIAQVTGASKAQPDLIEPLSAREVEILRMLTSDMTAPEIAEHLDIAVTTMRTHTRNIYGKLGVHSRYEAVSKAEELNLL